MIILTFLVAIVAGVDKFGVVSCSTGDLLNADITIDGTTISWVIPPFSIPTWGAYLILHDSSDTTSPCHGDLPHDTCAIDTVRRRLNPAIKADTNRRRLNPAFVWFDGSTSSSLPNAVEVENNGGIESDCTGNQGLCDNILQLAPNTAVNSWMQCYTKAAQDSACGGESLVRQIYVQPGTMECWCATGTLPCSDHIGSGYYEYSVTPITGSANLGSTDSVQYVSVLTAQSNPVPPPRRRMEGGDFWNYENYTHCHSVQDPHVWTFKNDYWDFQYVGWTTMYEYDCANYPPSTGNTGDSPGYCFKVEALGAQWSPSGGATGNYQIRITQTYPISTDDQTQFFSGFSYSVQTIDVQDVADWQGTGNFYVPFVDNPYNFPNMYDIQIQLQLGTDGWYPDYNQTLQIYMSYPNANEEIIMNDTLSGGFCTLACTEVTGDEDEDFAACDALCQTEGNFDAMTTSEDPSQGICLLEDRRRYRRRLSTDKKTAPGKSIATSRRLTTEAENACSQFQGNAQYGNLLYNNCVYDIDVGGGDPASVVQDTLQVQSIINAISGGFNSSPEMLFCGSLAAAECPADTSEHAFNNEVDQICDTEAITDPCFKHPHVTHEVHGTQCCNPGTCVELTCTPNDPELDSGLGRWVCTEETTTESCRNEDTTSHDPDLEYAPLCEDLDYTCVPETGFDTDVGYASCFDQMSHAECEGNSVTNGFNACSWEKCNITEFDLSTVTAIRESQGIWGRWHSRVSFDDKEFLDINFPFRMNMYWSVQVVTVVQNKLYKRAGYFYDAMSEEECLTLVDQLIDAGTYNDFDEVKAALVGSGYWNENSTCGNCGGVYRFASQEYTATDCRGGLTLEDDGEFKHNSTVCNRDTQVCTCRDDDTGARKMDHITLNLDEFNFMDNIINHVNNWDPERDAPSTTFTRAHKLTNDTDFSPFFHAMWNTCNVMKMVNCTSTMHSRTCDPPVDTDWDQKDTQIKALFDALFDHHDVPGPNTTYLAATFNDNGNKCNYNCCGVGPRYPGPTRPHCENDDPTDPWADTMCKCPEGKGNPPECTDPSTPIAILDCDERLKARDMQACMDANKVTGSGRAGVRHACCIKDGEPHWLCCRNGDENCFLLTDHHARVKDTVNTTIPRRSMKEAGIQVEEVVEEVVEEILEEPTPVA